MQAISVMKAQFGPRFTLSGRPPLVAGANIQYKGDEGGKCFEVMIAPKIRKNLLRRDGTYE
jgi:hypothetical protein